MIRRLRPPASKTSFRPALLGALCLVCGLATYGLRGEQQNQPQAPAEDQGPLPIFSVQAAMVVVDITVRDREGNLVKDLKREDFRVFEDNAPQQIVTFSAEKVALGPAPAETEAATDLKAPAVEKPVPAPVVNMGLNPNRMPGREDVAGKRLTILFFDLSSLGTEDLIRSVDSARDFIAAQTGPQDLIAVAVYSSILELVQDFTNDQNLILKTLNDLAPADSGDTAAENLGDADTSEEVFVPDTVQFDIFNTDRRLSAIGTLAKMYREFPERKSLVYFSSGMTTTGVENNAQIRSTVDQANRSNLSIYTVDSRGLVALPPGGDASQRSAGGRAMFSGAAMMRQMVSFSNSQQTLTTLARDTGGQTFTDSNDLSLALEQIQKDTNVYYVLGYFSSNSKEDGKYRKIRVELTRPGLKIEHRPGYFAAKSFKQMNAQERDLVLQQALTVDRPFSDVPVILQADYFRKDNSTTLVPVSIELDGDGLMFEEKGANREGRFEFVAQATSTKGKVTAVARDSVQVKLPAERAEKIKAGGIFYSTGFQLRPGDYKLKFLVRDNVTGKLGGFEQPLSVPVFDLKKLSTSSIVLGSQLASARGDAGSGVAHQGMMRRFQEMGISYNPLVTGNTKVVPSIGNVFLSQQTVYVYFHVYGAAEDPETKKPCIETDLVLIKDNTKILETQPRYVQEWIVAGGGPGFGGARVGGPGISGRGGMAGGRSIGGPAPGGAGRGEPGRSGQSPGAAGGELREGEATVAISLPLRNFKTGTYLLQIHVHDAISNDNLFERVPLVIR